MSRRHQIEQRLASYAEVRAILSAMKNIALTELRKLGGRLEQQRRAMATIERAADDFVRFYAPPGAAAQEPGVVRGRVIDRASGTPFAGAYIGIAGVAHNVLTDSAGQYGLPQAPAGSRHVEVPIAGYGTVFKLNPDGSGYTILKSFSISEGDGGYP